MSEENKLKYISALFVALENMISALNSVTYRHRIKQKYNELYKNFKSFSTLLIPKGDAQVVYDEWANQIIDIIEKSDTIGIERANAILDAYINNEIAIVESIENE